MIAVLAKDSEHVVVREFFELFKTPWEFYRSDREYDVLMCCHGEPPPDKAKLLLIYGSERRPFDLENGLAICSQHSNSILLYNGGRIPIYGKCATFDSAGPHLIADESTRRPAALEIKSGARKSVRIGFDLFHQVRHLLTIGQPPAHAALPALDLHIAVLRDLITGCAIPLVEIPPIPEGYNFIVCLTHDVDHVGVRNHKCDHTMFGFLYRAIIGSLINLCRGRQTWKQLARNWAAAFSLPFVHLGLARDFWFQLDHYLVIEKGLASTFFVIPRKGEPGQDANGRRRPKRAAKYDVAEIADQLHRLQSAGDEIGVHGIDAWRDSAEGRKEHERISLLTGSAELGVRMHWLFFDEQSPAALENAGFSYDSTVGYNETVGYRGGTSQAFKPLGLDRMLELPMHIMDTALFYPAHLNLSPKQASEAVAPLIDNAARFGGVLTVNWHDRSIAPERLWDDFYINLLGDLKSRGAWFPTAAQAVGWFRKRRSAVFEAVNCNGEGLQVKTLLSPENTNSPGLRLRVHKASTSQHARATTAVPERGFSEVAFSRSGEIRIPL